MRYSSRFFLYAPLALFLALAAWVMVYWWIVAGALDSKLTALNGHEALPGVTLSWQTKTITGFPFNLDVAFTGVTVRGQAAHGPFSWTAEKLVLRQAPATDRRSFIVRLTPKGASQFAFVARAHEGWVDELLADFDAAEADHLIEMLGGLASSSRGETQS